MRDLNALKDKKCRDAFVNSQIAVGLPFQIRALRKQRGWTQAVLAQKSGMNKRRIQALEYSTEGVSTRTLRRLASAFDIAICVSFVSFADLLAQSNAFHPDSFSVPSFKEQSDIGQR